VSRYREDSMTSKEDLLKLVNALPDKEQKEGPPEYDWALLRSLTMPDTGVFRRLLGIKDE
jgi:hypothetical protein